MKSPVYTDKELSILFKRYRTMRQQAERLFQRQFGYREQYSRGLVRRSLRGVFSEDGLLRSPVETHLETENGFSYHIDMGRRVYTFDSPIKAYLWLTRRLELACNNKVGMHLVTRRALVDLLSPMVVELVLGVGVY